jgi:cation:H+ antiporter
MIYFLFLIGFYLLAKGADLLVEGSGSIAKRFGISDIVIGLTIVSVGTSLPELIVNVLASYSGSADIAIGNIIGSNIANISLILGVTVVISNVPVSRGSVFNEIPFSLLAILLVGFVANASVWPGEEESLEGISRTDGLFLLVFFLVFMVYVVSISKDIVLENDLNPADSKIYKHIAYSITGCILLFLGGKWVVDGAIQIAQNFGMSEKLISLTIVAIGTSLPELVTSVVAAVKNKSDLAVGNVVGSNIFNALWILGLSSLIHPLPFHKSLNFDLMYVVLTTLLLLLLILIRRHFELIRWQGIVLLISYCFFITYLIIKE